MKWENSVDVKGNNLQIINVTVVRIYRKWVIEMVRTTRHASGDEAGWKPRRSVC
jgi:hypothetical protein